VPQFEPAGRTQFPEQHSPGYVPHGFPAGAHAQVPFAAHASEQHSGWPGKAESAHCEPAGLQVHTAMQKPTQQLFVSLPQSFWLSWQVQRPWLQLSDVQDELLVQDEPIGSGWVPASGRVQSWQTFPMQHRPAAAQSTPPAPG
jgi:hypothetical protein